MSQRLTMKIDYPMDETKEPSILSDINREYWEEVLEGYIRLQMGKGEDKTPAQVREKYEIVIQIDLADDDAYYCRHDCGNKGLRDGILLKVLSRIARGEVDEL